MLLVVHTYQSLTKATEEAALKDLEAVKHVDLCMNKECCSRLAYVVSTDKVFIDGCALLLLWTQVMRLKP